MGRKDVSQQSLYISNRGGEVRKCLGKPFPMDKVWETERKVKLSAVSTPKQ